MRGAALENDRVDEAQLSILTRSRPNMNLGLQPFLMTGAHTSLLKCRHPRRPHESQTAGPQLSLCLLQAIAVRFLATPSHLPSILNEDMRLR
jgi:hypothetical protein